MPPANILQTQTKLRIAYPLLVNKERLLIWEKIRGLWKNRRPDPLKELQRMREEWDRDLTK